MVRYSITITKTTITVLEGETVLGVIVRKNSGANVGTEERLNFIEGANITLTIVDDPANNEIDITIASAASGEEWLDEYYPAVSPQDAKGTYPGILMAEGTITSIYFHFMIPDDITTVTTADVRIIAEATGNLGWECATQFSACGEDYLTHTDGIVATTTAVTDNEKECISILSALDGASGGDDVGLLFSRITTDDTVAGDVYFLGVLIQGAA